MPRKSGSPPQNQALANAVDNGSYDFFAAQFAAHLDTTRDDGYFTPATLYSGAPSPTSSEGTAMAADSTDDYNSSTSGSHLDSKSAQKAKRANRYKNCSEAVLSRRRAQNRANQRAYRKRKEQRLQELQEQLDNVNQKNNALTSAYAMLAGECSRLKSGNGAPQWQSAIDDAPLDVNTSLPFAVDLGADATMAGLNAVPDAPGSPEQWWNPYP